MIILPDISRDILHQLQRRVEAVRNAGGISDRDVEEGKIVPPSYWYDPLTQCHVPENVDLLALSRSKLYC